MGRTSYTLRDGRQLLLREPQKSDAADCLEFLKRVGAETDFLLCDENGIPGMTLESEEQYLESAAADPKTGMFLGFVGGELVTVFDVRPHTRARTAHNATISLSILREYWHLGIGTIAMQTMIAFARAAGTVKILNLEVHAGNARAIALYERFGFAVVGRHKDRLNVRGEYFDELLMDLAL